MKRILPAILPLLILALSRMSPIYAGEARPVWREEWEKTVAAAKREGQLAIYGQSGDEGIYVEAFQKAFPFVRVAYTSGRLSELVSRIMTERRAGKYLADLAIGGTTIPLETLKPAAVLEPIRPLLILPEVLDGSAWFQKKLWFADSENKYVVIWRGSVSPLFSINTNLANAAEFKAYSDLLNPKWKGKIVALDPRRPGNAANLTVFLYATPSLGRNFLRRLFGEMDVTFSNDRYQIVDWLARGKFAVNLFSPVRKEEIKTGLPLAEVKVDGPAAMGVGAASQRGAAVFELAPLARGPDRLSEGEREQLAARRHPQKRHRRAGRDSGRGARIFFLFARRERQEAAGQRVQAVFKRDHPAELRGESKPRSSRLMGQRGEVV